MDNLDDLKTRIERAIFELREIAKLLEKDIVDSRKAVSFGQVKEIQASIARLKRQGLPIPTELRELKIKLFSEHENLQERISLYQTLQQNIRGLIQQEIPPLPKKTPITAPNGRRSPYRRPSNYEKPLGSKGYSNLEDYLIPVINLIWSGCKHTDAFHQVAKKLDVRVNTVRAQCTKAIGLTTDEFIGQVNSRTIVGLLETKYSDQYRMIRELLQK